MASTCATTASTSIALVVGAFGRPAGTLMAGVVAGAAAGAEASSLLPRGVTRFCIFCGKGEGTGAGGLWLLRFAT